MRVIKDGNSYKFSDISNAGGDIRSRTMRSFIVETNKAGSMVWFDSYGEEITQDHIGTKNTVYGWLSPDNAEMLGLALIDMARKARAKKL